MNIIKSNFTFKKSLSKRTKTSYIVLHHREGNGDVQSIHTLHLNRGFVGIGYHFYIRKDGKIYEGRPTEKIGEHCTNFNSVSLGICFEGNFDKETMTDAQKKSGIELVNHLKELYPAAEIVKHKDLRATSCPGKNFPFNEIKNGKQKKIILTSANDIIWELANGKEKVEILDVDRAVKCLDIAKQENNSLYWILYKIVNKE